MTNPTTTRVRLRPVADISDEMVAAVKADLLDQANADNAAYPQYQGYFDAHVVARVKTPRRSRGQQIMTRGQFVLLDPTSFERRDSMPGYMAEIDKGDPAEMFVTVYLHTNLSGCNTVIRAKDVEVVR
jgi:hypothetical protein